jgi:hypothetical protein
LQCSHSLVNHSNTLKEHVLILQPYASSAALKIAVQHSSDVSLAESQPDLANRSIFLLILSTTCSGQVVYIEHESEENACIDQRLLRIWMLVSKFPNAVAMQVPLLVK